MHTSVNSYQSYETLQRMSRLAYISCSKGDNQLLSLRALRPWFGHRIFVQSLYCPLKAWELHHGVGDLAQPKWGKTLVESAKVLLKKKSNQLNSDYHNAHNSCASLWYWIRVITFSEKVDSSGVYTLFPQKSLPEKSKTRATCTDRVYFLSVKAQKSPSVKLIIFIPGHLHCIFRFNIDAHNWNPVH